MTTRARLVLEDCKIAYKELLEALQGEQGRQGRKEFGQRISKGIDSEERQRERRIRWVTVLVLLGSVKYALERDKRKDKSEFPRKEEIIDEALSDLKGETIYAEFIRNERNNIVHQYKFGVGEIEITTAEFKIPPSWSEDGKEHIFRMPAGISYPIAYGRYAGQEQAKIALEAIEFWDEFLTKVEEKIQIARQKAF